MVAPRGKGRGGEEEEEGTGIGFVYPRVFFLEITLIGDFF